VAIRLAQGLVHPKCSQIGFCPIFKQGRNGSEFCVNRLWLLIVPLVLLVSASCGRPAELRVNEAVLKLSPVDNNPSALYFTVHGGTQDVTLLRVSSPSVLRAEMHDTVSEPKTGMLTMTKIDRIKVPAEGKVEFKRGGKHVMLWGVNLIARRLEKIDVEFVFSNGDRIRVTAPVEKIAAGKDGHSGH
jgi:periplasmic copper chaperone A